MGHFPEVQGLLFGFFAGLFRLSGKYWNTLE